MSPNEYYLLIHKSLSGQITPSEENRLSSWLNEDPANQEMMNELRMLWDAASDADDFVYPDDTHIQKQKDRLEKNLEAAKKREIAQYRSGIFYRNVALAIFLIIIVAFPIILLNQQRSPEPVTMAIRKNRTLILPDSTSVSLNKDSELSFALTSNERTVKFQGEAFFKVAKDERKPFKIQLPRGEIKVLGTSFFVKAYPEDTTEIVVSSGRVEVTSNNQKLTLSKGDKSILPPDSDLILKSINEDPNFNSWYTQKLQFKKTKFKKIISLLEDQYHVPFKVSNPEILACRFTGTFDNEALDTILIVLSRSLDFSFHLQDGIYFIEGKGCNDNRSR